MSVGAIPRHDVALAVRQVRYEQRSFWRNRQGAFFGFVLPLIFLVLLGALNGGSHLSALGGISYITFFVPGILAYGSCMATFATLGFTMVNRLDSGILKRLRGTPVPGWVLLAGLLGSTTIATAASATVTIVVGVLAFGAHLRVGALPAIVVTLALGIACFSTLGVGMARFVRRPDAAGPVLNGILLPLTFISGIWFPTQNEPGWLRTTAQIFPVEHLAHALQTAFDPHTTGTGFAGADLLVLAAWTLAGAWLTTRFLHATIEP